MDGPREIRRKAVNGEDGIREGGACQAECQRQCAMASRVGADPGLGRAPGGGAWLGLKVTRPPITPERMLGEASKAQVIYRSDAVHPRHQANFRVFAPLDFLAEVRTHIPDAHEKTTLFYGWYSNRTRGYRKRHGPLAKSGVAEPAADDEGTRAPLKVRRSWARLIRQAYEVDPLVCSRCGGTMKILAVIERPAIVRQILATWASPAKR